MNPSIARRTSSRLHRSLAWTGGALLLGGLIFALPLFTQASFDPASVQPTNCRNGNFNCGYQPTSSERAAAVPLSDQTMVRHRGLPSRVDLSANMPAVGNQGQQGSCVAWATGYALKSFHEKAERGWDYDSPVRGGRGDRVFSPAFLYNQINGGRDNGSVIDDAFNVMIRQGAAPWSAMPYNPSDYRSQPSAAARQVASQFKAKSYRRIPYHNLDAIKAELAQGNPVAFGIPVDDAFYQLGSGVYDAKRGQNYGGHAMTLVGYDDSKTSGRGHRGAFKLINSWGTGWGDQGYGWISYDMWRQLGAYTLVLYDVKGETDGPEPGEEIEQQEETIDPPSNITASRGTFPDKVAVNWNAVNGAVVYILFRAPPNAENFEQLGYTQTTTYEDKNVQQNVAYQYIVISVKSEEVYSDPRRSEVVQGWAAAQTQTRPDQVAGLQGQLVAVGGSGAVRLSWNQTPGASRYQVARFDNGSQAWRILANTASSSHSDNRPQANASNYYSVRGVNSNGAGEWSDPIEVAVGGASQPPAAPSSLRASQGTHRDRIVVQWNRVPGANAYYVFRYDYDEGAWQGPIQASGTSLADQHASVRSGKWFAYTVVASNAAGNSDYAQPVTGRANPNATRAGLIVEPPQNVRSQVNEAAQTVQIRWDKVDGASEYYVFRKARETGLLSGGGEFEFVGAASANQTTYSEKLPERGKLYFYTVRAKSALGGESENSERVAGYANAAPQENAANFRSAPGDGLQAFTGTWLASYWDGSGKPQDVRLEISSQPMSAEFSGSIQIGTARARPFSGNFASGARSLESAAGLKMLMVDEDDRFAAVTLLPGSLAKETIELSFRRADAE